jgi:CheY-like chemotaxis protein
MQSPPKRVLYAEDEYTSRKILKISLNKNGIDCDLAEDGNAAVEMCQNNFYDLVILDHYMPGLNGDKIAQKIKSFKPDLPLIAITSDDELVSHLKKSGFTDVIIKPIYKHNFINTIKKYL